MTARAASEGCEPTGDRRPRHRPRRPADLADAYPTHLCPGGGGLAITRWSGGRRLRSDKRQADTGGHDEGEVKAVSECLVNQIRQAGRPGDHRGGLAAAERADEIMTGGVLEPAAENLTKHGDPERVAELAEGADRAGRHAG